MEPDRADDQSAPAGPPVPDDTGPPVPDDTGLPEQSAEDTDSGWGEFPEPDDDRFYRDRPPHWDSA